ncbi:MAG: SAM-dependent methyltransferase [Sphingobacteriales bacterium]|nr:MAG: SAM-dependent methyltransferase [Sphingobacteriales bacterium]
MERKIIVTKDGSNTFEFPDVRGTYHSRHGALAESRHVFLEQGLQWALTQFPGAPLSLFEMGFGSGLNALLTAIEAQQRQRFVQYVTIEAFPIPVEEALALNYGELLSERELFQQLHKAPWAMETAISDYFTIRKEETSLEDLQLTGLYHLVYYDAFAPSSQPELWTAERFRQVYDLLLPGGAMVTYCSKTVVRRAMEAAGFTVTKPPGPWGKREMVRAVKP